MATFGQAALPEFPRPSIYRILCLTCYLLNKCEEKGNLLTGLFVVIHLFTSITQCLKSVLELMYVLKGFGIGTLKA